MQFLHGIGIASTILTTLFYRSCTLVLRFPILFSLFISSAESHWKVHLMDLRTCSPQRYSNFLSKLQEYILLSLILAYHYVRITIIKHLSEINN